MTLAVQASMKKSDGTIYVIGGDDFDSFYGNMVALSGGETTLADDVLADMIRCLSPMAGAVATVQNGMPGAQVTGNFYTPQGQPQPQQAANGSHTSTMPVAVKIPWAEKQMADPYLTPLKATSQAKWDATNKQWILMPGVDLGPFARWLPPGS